MNDEMGKLFDGLEPQDLRRASDWLTQKAEALEAPKRAEEERAKREAMRHKLRAQYENAPSLEAKLHAKARLAGLGHE